jgi:hypothetical protein
MRHEYQETDSSQREIEYYSRPQAGRAQAIRKLERRYQKIIGKEEACDRLAEVSVKSTSSLLLKLL